MSLKFKFDDKQNNPAQDQGSASGAEQHIEKYGSPGEGKSICFIQPDGKKTFLNYAYLIGGELSPEEDQINLIFSTHHVELKGHALDNLFDDLAQSLPKTIKCSDERYLQTQNFPSSVVTRIEISTKE